MRNASKKKCLALFQFILIYFKYFIFKRKVKTKIEVQCKKRKFQVLSLATFNIIILNFNSSPNSP